jgi:DNA repair exonuclease SbcCD ATPase subunit
LNSKSSAKPSNDGLLKDEIAESKPCKVPSSFDCKLKTLCKNAKGAKCKAFKKSNGKKGERIAALTKKAKELRKNLRKLRKDAKDLKKASKKNKSGKATKEQKKRSADLKKLIQQTRTQLLETMAARRTLNLGTKALKKLPKGQSQLLKLRANLIKSMTALDKLEKKQVKLAKKNPQSQKKAKALKNKIKKLRAKIAKLEKKVLKASTENNVDISRLKRIAKETKADTSRYSAEIKSTKDKKRSAELTKRVNFNKDFSLKLDKYIKNIETKRKILKKKKLDTKDYKELGAIVKKQIKFMKRWIKRVTRRLT